MLVAVESLSIIIGSDGMGGGKTLRIFTVSGGVGSSGSCILSIITVGDRSVHTFACIIINLPCFTDFFAVCCLMKEIAENYNSSNLAERSSSKIEKKFCR